MVKAAKKNTWKPVEIDGALINNDFDGLIGIEECTDYDLNDFLPSNKKKRVRDDSKDKSGVPSKKKKITKQIDEDESDDETVKTNVNNKKKQHKQNNPKEDEINSDRDVKKSKKKKLKKKKADINNEAENGIVSKNKKNKKVINEKAHILQKNKIGKGIQDGFVEEDADAEEVYENDSDESLEIEEVFADSDDCPDAVKIEEIDMQAWNIIPLPEPILKALQEQKFSQPTEIQTLTLPAAVLGKRDILGAAETGSGKTLAFGLPILCGIMKLKSDAAENVDIDEDLSNADDFKDKLVTKESSDSEDDNYEEIMGASEDEDEEIDEFENQIVMGDDDENSEESSEEEEDSHLKDNDEDEDKSSVDCEENLEGEDAEGSDFEETEENVNSVDTEGIGCIRSVNNIRLPGLHPKKPLYALILTPTRELAVQIKNHLVAAAKYIDVNVAVVVGGMAAVKQERILKKGPEIVVATPGRLWELIQLGNAHLSQIDDIRYLAIDETDRMIERGHFQELHHILDRINVNEEKKKLRQNFVFSATLTLVHEMPKHVLKSKKRARDSTAAQKLKKVIDTLGITNPKVVDITKGKGTSGTLTECRISCSIDHKDYYVYYFLQRHPGRTLIFCNSIGCVRRLSTLFDLLGCKPMPLHASMQQRQRLKNLDRFRDNENGLLIATDVAARGLDIPSVEHVIHYQTPRTSESYVHRSGRTARASKEGITVLLVEPTELPNYLRLCRTLGKSEDIPLFPVEENYLSAVKQRVNLARELDKLELQVKKTNSKAGWFQKVAEDMDIIVDNKSLKYDMEEAKDYKKACDFKRKQLTALLETPVFPKGFNVRYPLLGNSEDLLRIQGEAKPQSAVDVMKNALEEKPLKFLRKKPKSLFKSKISNKDEKIVVKDLMKGNNKNTKGRERKKKFNKKGNK